MMEMKSANVLTGVLAIAVVAALVVWLASEHRARLRLAQEHRSLKQQADQLSDLIETNEQLSNRMARAVPSRSAADNALTELLRLRGEVGVLRQQTRELETVRDENRQAHAALESSLRNRNAKNTATADYWPRDSWAFAGYGNADAAMQTALWAANNGDFKTLAACTTGDAQKILEAEIGGKSETEAAVRVMDHVMSLKSVRVLNREAQGDDTVVISAEFEGAAGPDSGKLVLKKIGNEWKLAALP